MIQPFDPVCFDAYARLLALPDPPEMPRRGHVVRWEGSPNRRAKLFPLILWGWLQHHYLVVDGEECLAFPRAAGDTTVTDPPVLG
jgi:hypothetical protein